jgi:hypothetical protein
MEWNNGALVEIDNAPAELLMRIAAEVQSSLVNELGTMNPPPYVTPSQPGEYPRKRTGFLQSQVVYEPTSKAAIASQGSVRVGYSQNAFYGSILEIARKRLGLLATMDSLKGRIEELAK